MKKHISKSLEKYLVYNYFFSAIESHDFQFYVNIMLN